MLDKEFTQKWWSTILKDPAKILKWLDKLEKTEWEGYADHCEFIKNNEVVLTSKQILILNNIAKDELYHSSLLNSIIKERGGTTHTQESSKYWAEVLHPDMGFKEYCAANYFGEDIAAWRFEVILEMPETPSDIKEFIRLALPDEIFHRTTLFKQAGEDVIEQLRPKHEAALNKLLKK